MSNFNYGKEARLRIARWVNAGKLIINDETGHWEWTGTRIKDVPMMRYGGKMYPVHKFLFQSFYSQFQLISPINRGCDCKGCVNPLHRYVMDFIDIKHNVKYSLTRENAKKLFTSSLNPVSFFGVYDLKANGEASASEEAADAGLAELSNEEIDLALLRRTLPSFKSVVLLPQTIKEFPEDIGSYDT